MSLPWGTNQNLDDNQFYNRENEIVQFKNLLNSTKEGNAPDILLTGIRGIGKTVFLKKIKRELESEYLVIYIDFSQAECFQKNNMNITGIMEYYYKQIMIESKNRNIKTLNKKIEKFFKTNKINIKDISNYNGFPIPLIETNINEEELINFILNLPEEIYNENKSKIDGIIVLIDEFQIIKELNEYVESFLWKFRSFVQNQRNVAYVLSGSMSIQDKLIYEIASSNGVFGGRMISFNLTSFEKETTKNYLNEKAPNLNFSKEGFDRFYKCTSGIPSYINIFAKILPNDVLLTEDVIKKEFNEGISIISSHLINIWTKLSYREQSIIIAILDEPLRRIDISKKLDVTTGSISNYLNNLQNQGLIKLDNDKYAISEPLLSKWLKLEYENKGIYPYRI